MSKKYPHGKLTEDDEGALDLAILTHEGNVVIDFGGKPVTWIGFPPDQARQMGQSLIDKANEIESS